MATDLDFPADMKASDRAVKLNRAIESGRVFCYGQTLVDVRNEGENIIVTTDVIYRTPKPSVEWLAANGGD
jgi:hypothetical protein